MAEILRFAQNGRTTARSRRYPGFGTVSVDGEKLSIQ